jgi:hypothetical protein
LHHRLQESIPHEFGQRDAAQNRAGVPCPAAQEHQTPTDNPVIHSEHRINLDIVTTTQRSCLTKQCVTKGFKWFSFLILILFFVAIIALFMTSKICRQLENCNEETAATITKYFIVIISFLILTWLVLFSR